MRAKRLRAAASILSAVAVGGALYLLWYAPPLRASGDYRLSFVVSGVAQPGAELFRPIGYQSRYYVSIPPQPGRYYRWFMVDFERHFAALPSFGVTCPFGSPCLHRDQEFGILLTDPKTEDNWKVAFASDGVEFSNATLTIRLTKNR